MTAATAAAKIRALNDALRATFRGGRVLVTPGVRALPLEEGAAVLGAVRGFAAFTAENDPHGEHDFGSFELGGFRILWKIDCYDPELIGGSEDPTDPAKTVRVLTVMLAEEY
jgi:hypothetical protein